MVGCVGYSEYTIGLLTQEYHQSELKKRRLFVAIDTPTFFPWLVTTLAVVPLMLVWGLLSFRRIKNLRAESAQYRQNLEQLTTEINEQRVQHDAVLMERERQASRLETLVQEKEQQLCKAQEAVAQLTLVKEDYLKLEARFQEKEAQLQSKESLIEESKKTLFREFELAANKLFESKQQSFTQSSKQNMEAVLLPFKQQLKDFNRQVEDVYHKENTQRNQLIGQIGELQKQAKQISEDANHLASALKGDNKVQGQWGEIILERLLEQSGLTKGREYETQLNYKDEAGKNYRPDVVIHLPEAKDIIVDSKVALVEYERYVREDEKDAKEQCLKSHIEAIRTHIKGLSLKKYEQLEGINTIDFVFMFVPIEAAYVAAVQNAPTLFKEAYDKNIMLVSPSSLMVALRTVETMWRYEKQNANAEKIAISAGRLYDQFTLVATALEEVGTHLHRATESHNTVFKRLSEGRGNVLKRIEDIKKLGAKTSKQLPGATHAMLNNDSELDVAEHAPLEKIEEDAER